MAAFGAAAVLPVAGIVAFGSDGHPAQRVRLLSGAAWLPSAKVGQLTLLDGSSAEVAAQVQITAPGHALDVVQQGATAYAVDRTTGTVRAVDGATFEPTPPRSPIPDASSGLTAFASPSSLYTVDIQRGMLAISDAKTLEPHGKPMSLASGLTAGAGVLDGSGWLWLIDTGTGDLTRVADGRRTVRRQATRPGAAMLTVAGGHPVIVNVAERTATAVDPGTGEPAGSFPLDLRPTDTVAAGGSPRGQRFYLTASRGVLTVCTLAPAGCTDAVALTPGGDFGAPVESGGRVFVPDHTTGQVWIVDLASNSVVARPQVLTPPGKFQLLTRDGVVFFNDPDSERAGVVTVDGRVTAVAKYDPRDPGRGLNTPRGGEGPAQPDAQPKPDQQADQPAPDQPRPDQPRPREPTTSPTRPNQPTTPPPATPTTTPGPGPQPDPEPRLRITLSAANPTVRQEITLRVGNATGPPPTGAVWSFGDGEQGSGVTVSHAWAAARTFQVSVRATLPGGREVSTSVSVTVGAMPAPVLLSPADGTVFDHYEPDTTVTWQAVNGAARYRVEVRCAACTGGPGWPADIDTTVTTTSHTFPWLRMDASPRRWRVTAIAGDGTSAASGWRQFSFDPRIHPDKPVLTGPANGTRFSNVPRTVTLSWRPVVGTEFLNLQVDCLGCQTPGQWSSVLRTNVGNSGNVPNEHTFEYAGGATQARWRIRGIAPDNTVGEWSDYGTFEFTA